MVVHRDGSWHRAKVRNGSNLGSTSLMTVTKTTPPRLASHLALTAGLRFILSISDQPRFSQLLPFVLASTVNLARWCERVPLNRSSNTSNIEQYEHQVPPLARTFVLGEVVPPGGDWSRPALQFVKDAVEGFTCRWCLS